VHHATRKATGAAVERMRTKIENLRDENNDNEYSTVAAIVWILRSFYPHWIDSRFVSLGHGA
jgi:hypothetical protein